jgi:ABC-2 type transport system ATP-binding protein
MDTVIQTQGLMKFFGAKRVLDRLDLSVPKGAIYALLGDNGAGKSTTIRILTGLLQPDAGRASVLGQDCWRTAYALRHRVGYVPEKPRFYDWMTVAEIGGFTAGFHRDGYRERYLSLIDRFGLERSGKLANQSKGAYAKVGLALALAGDPEVLILDEPTSGLDLFTRREFLGSMVELAAEGRTILISSHGISEIERVASHVAFLVHGQLLLAGPLDELKQRTLRVRVRHDGTLHDPAGLGAVLDYEAAGREWQAVILDPDVVAVEDLRHRPGVLDLEESPLKLEEMYTALLARYHRRVDRNGTAHGEPALIPDALGAERPQTPGKGGRR